MPVLSIAVNLSKIIFPFRRDRPTKNMNGPHLFFMLAISVQTGE